jgi:hypothetical protein
VLTAVVVALVGAMTSMSCTWGTYTPYEGGAGGDAESSVVTPTCGDGICNGTETCKTCPHDCPCGAMEAGGAGS